MRIKKILSNIIAVMVLGFIVMAGHVTINASEISDIIYEINLKIPEESAIFAEKNYKDILAASYPYYTQIVSDDWNEYSLGEPYVIYDPDATTWNEVYYYPILYKNEIVLVASIINTTNGWTLSASDEIIDGLKKINYKDNSSLFYELDDCILAVSNEETKVIQSDEKEKSLNYNKKEKKFEEISSIEKASEILENIDNMKPVDIKQIQFSTQNNNIKEEYTPLFSEDRNSGSDYIKVCSLYNKQGQGSLPICWAASIATIVNYRLGTNYTAKDICDNEGLEYKGANIDTKQQALKTYGLFYDKMTSQLSWELIVKNINNKYLIAASTFDGRGNGHSITVYGYKFTNANKYIVLHNPGTNDTQIVLYKTGGSTYTYNNKTWTWTKSLYYYR